MAAPVLGVVGAVAGGIIAGPQGAYIGFSLGYTIGNIIDPPNIPGPKLGESGLQTSRDSVPIPVIWGVQSVTGNIIAQLPYVDTEKKVSTKGGPTTTETRRTRTYAIGICRGPIGGLLRIWENEKLIYDARPNATLPSADTIAVGETFNLYLGDEEQLPDSELETYFGVGTTPAYRGLAYITWLNRDLTDFVGAIPQYTFEISSCPVVSLKDSVLGWWECEEPSGGATTPLYDQVAAYIFRSSNAMNSVPGVRGQGVQVTASGDHLVSEGLPDSMTLKDQFYSITTGYITPSDVTGHAGTYICCSWRDANIAGAPERRKYRITWNAAGDGFSCAVGYGPGFGDIAEIDTGNINVQPNTKYQFTFTHDPDANQMSFTASIYGESVGTRLTQNFSGGAWPGTAPPILNESHFWGRDLAGTQFSEGTIDMYAVWSIALSEDNVAALVMNEWTYDELP